jgi:carbon monoxide dehydrogenase subunit G
VKLENEFTVPASIEQAWAVLLDVPRVAPCLPGATVEPGDEDGEYKGAMKLKIGPITASYRGTVKILEADEAAHSVAMRAQAKDARGQGTAAATITSTMQEVAEGTKISVVTDLRVTGPAASFGRGVMQDVSAKLMGRFADCLAEEMRGDASAATAAAGQAPAPEAGAEPAVSAPAAPADTPEAATIVESTGVPGASSGVSSAAAEDKVPSASSGTSSASTATPPRPSEDVLDLGEASRDAILKRAVPLVGGVVALLLVLRLIRRR